MVETIIESSQLEMLVKHWLEEILDSPVDSSLEITGSNVESDFYVFNDITNLSSKLKKKVTPFLENRIHRLYNLALVHPFSQLQITVIGKKV